MKIHILFIGVVLVLSISSKSLSACDCDIKSVRVAYNEALTVVLGTVISIEKKITVMSPGVRDSIQNLRQQLFFSDTVQYTVYTFRIDRKIKADYAQDTIQIIVGPLRSDCDLDFKLDHSYVLYADDISWKREIFPAEENIPYFFTTMCMRTTEDVELETSLLKSYGYWN